MTRTWTAHSPLSGARAPATRDANGDVGVTLEEMPWRPALRIAAGKGQSAPLAAAVRAIAGLDLPGAGRRAVAGHIEILWAGPGQWLAMAPDDAALAPLRTGLAGLAAVTEQGDGLVIVRLAGKKARRALMKLVGIDVHPAAFAVDAVALAPIAHVPVQLWRLPDDGAEAVFEIALPQSYAASLWDTLIDACAELGLDARPAPQPAAPK